MYQHYAQGVAEIHWEQMQFVSSVNLIYWYNMIIPSTGKQLIKLKLTGTRAEIFQ